MYLADKVTTGTNNFVSLIVKIILLWLAFAPSLPAKGKTQYFVHLSFTSILQLITVQVIYKNYTAIAAFFRITFALFGVGLPTLFPNNNLALYSKDFKLSVLSVSLLTLVASSFE